MTIIDDDARDLAIHNRIEVMIGVFVDLRAMTRAQVFEQFCNGDGMFDHGLQAICEMHNLTRSEINERVSAFIEAEKEEEAERHARLIRSACELEMEESA